MQRVLGRYVEPIVAAVGVVVFLALLLLIGVAAVGPRDHGLPPDTAAILGDSWPGAPDSCVTEEAEPNCYREPIVTDAIVKQPVSTYSALALSAAGLLILWRMAYERARGIAGANPMTADRFYQGALGWVAVLMGPGAILFHATVTGWGGVLDQLSMYLLLGFMAAYNLVRGARPSADRLVFLGVFGGIVAIGFLLAALAGDAGLVLFALSAGLVGAFEVATLAYFLPRTGYVRNLWSFGLAVLALAVAFAFWIPGNPAIGGGPTEFPFHLFWHVVSAVFVVAYFYYLRTEKAKTR